MQVVEEHTDLIKYLDLVAKQYLIPRKLPKIPSLEIFYILDIDSKLNIIYTVSIPLNIGSNRSIYVLYNWFYFHTIVCEITDNLISLLSYFQ